MGRQIAILATLAFVVAALTPVPVSAASTWTARTTWTGSLGSLGAASLGVGSPDRLTIHAKSLKAGITYAVTLRRGTCATGGALVMSKRMTASRLGTISQTLFLTSTQTRLATLPLAVRVGSRCAPLMASLGVTTTTVGSVSSTVPASGGTAQIAEGASVVFPPGALASDATVSITALAPSSPSSQGSAAAWPSQPVGDLYRVDAPASSFKAPVTLTLPVPATASTGDLVLAYFNPATGTWLPVPSALDASAQTITAQVDHLSTWGIFDLSSWLVALGGLASGDLHSFFQGTSDLLTPCQPGTGTWHVDNTFANNMVEGCVTTQTDQSLDLSVRNLRLYPLEITNAHGYVNTVIGAGEVAKLLPIARGDPQPLLVTASMTQDTMYSAIAMSLLDEISLVAPLGDSVGTQVVSVAGHKVALSVISDLASAIKGAVDLGPIWSDLKAKDFTQAASEFTRLIDNDTVLTAVSLALTKIALASGWYSLGDVGAATLKIAMVALAPLLAGKVIVEMVTMIADYFFNAQTSVTVTWGDGPDHNAVLAITGVVNAQHDDRECGGPVSCLYDEVDFTILYYYTGTPAGNAYEGLNIWPSTADGTLALVPGWGYRPSPISRGLGRARVDLIWDPGHRPELGDPTMQARTQYLTSCMYANGQGTWGTPFGCLTIPFARDWIPISH